jgi:hypothetical protein
MPPIGTLVAELAVELDDQPKIRERHVMPVSGPHRVLCNSGRQSMRGQNVPGEPDLQRALPAGFNLGQDLPQVPRVALARSGGQRRAQRPRRGQPARTRARDDGDGAIEVVHLREVERGVLDRRSPWPQQLVGPLAHVGAATHPYCGRVGDAAIGGDEDVDAARLRVQQPVEVCRRLM